MFGVSSRLVSAGHHFDAIVTPGTGLRQILDTHGLLHFFDVFIFSDEAGAAKPSPVVFRQAISGFDIEPGELIHIGDRETNDVEGPIDFGSMGVLYTGVIDRGGSQKAERQPFAGTTVNSQALLKASSNN